MARITLRLAAMLLLVCAGTTLAAKAETRTIARCGAGFLDDVDGYRVLHVTGEPYEMGYQHGALLKEEIRQNLDYVINVKGATKITFGPLTLSPRVAIESIVKHQEKYIPQKYFDEMAGLSAASGVPRSINSTIVS